jgi:hypothetical protein
MDEHNWRTAVRHLCLLCDFTRDVLAKPNYEVYPGTKQR